jgi:hypothetical protein
VDGHRARFGDEMPMEINMATKLKRLKNRNAGSTILKSHGDRIAALEKNVVALTATAQTVDVEFDLDSATTAHLARCYVPGTTQAKNDLANNMGKPHGVLKNRQVGSVITVVVQASDSTSSNAAVFNTTHTDVSQIACTADDGTANFDLTVTA